MRSLTYCDAQIDELRGCMARLHGSIASLHARHLFPYNAAPLLRRLEAFEEALDGSDNGDKHTLHTDTRVYSI